MRKKQGWSLWTLNVGMILEILVAIGGFIGMIVAVINNRFDIASLISIWLVYEFLRTDDK
jgi:apolipoprotein N-acyltransferase